jgi:poly(A) polymerase Pap1
MDTATKKQYDHYLKNVRVSESMLDTAKFEGKIEGKIEIILKSFDAGLDIDLITLITNMSQSEVINVLREHGRME